MGFRSLEPRELQSRKSELMDRYRAFQARNLEIDMTRGKPCPEQLDLSVEMLTCVDAQHYTTEGGVDCRNYGGLDGIPEAKQLFSEYLGVKPDEIIIGGSSSLNMMYDTIVYAMLRGNVDSDVPWGRLPEVRFICPCPGYDRHFNICEHLGIRMVPVEMKADGPDMDAVEQAVAEDEQVKGMWCVPKYSNPTGVVCSDEVVERLAQMIEALLGLA